MPDNLESNLRALIHHYRTVLPRLHTTSGTELVEQRRKLNRVETCICNALPLERREEALQAIRQTGWDSNPEPSIQALRRLFRRLDVYRPEE